jgi:CRP/FNR family cyclic AMP-dependent transcriptional regulator
MASPLRYLWINPFRREHASAVLCQLWQQTPLLTGLKPRDARELVARTHLRRYRPGEAMFREGETGVAAALVVSGTLRVQSGSGTIIHLEPGDFFGESALLEDTPRSATVVADSDVTVSLLVRYQLEEFVQFRPRVGTRVMTNLARLLAARLRMQIKATEA